MEKTLEKLLWSIAFPGFAQLLNGKIVKGIVLIGLEILINLRANMNRAIMASFHGDIEYAIQLIDYQWLLFYPCIYLFAIWDGYKDAGGGKASLSFLPFIFSAYSGTIGVIYSPTLSILGTKLGPIFLPVLFLLLGAVIGILIRMLILKLVINQ